VKRGDNLLALGLLGIGALLLSGDTANASSSSSSGGSSGRWPTVPPQPTGTGPALAYDQARFNALGVALRAHNAPLDTVTRLARAMLAQFVSETGRVAEYNFNPANMVANANWSGQVAVRSGMAFRAYPDLQAGVDDYLNAISQGRYAQALADLVANNNDEATWYLAVRAAGWTERPATGEELATYNAVLGRLYTEFPG
jgi:hypothetical protein